jgi:hypothetical protein
MAGGFSKRGEPAMYRITQALAALTELKADLDDLPEERVRQINWIIRDLKALHKDLANVPDPVAEKIRHTLDSLTKMERL